MSIQTPETGHPHGHAGHGGATHPVVPPVPVVRPPEVIRHEVRALDADFKAAYVGALLKLKKEGRYDEYVHWHHTVMYPTVYPHEPRTADYRNGAHLGPSFLPWHRAFLLVVEADLRAIDRDLFIPFWDWTIDAAMEHPEQAPIWHPDFLGGDGEPTDGWRVQTGPFAYRNGNWPIPEGMDGPALRRAFAQIVPTLPSAADVDLAMAELYYDTPPFNRSPFTIGLRNRLEGWITSRGDPRVSDARSQLHNRVHLWVGGSMTPMTSPNDPVFFLHHAMVDKVWADWQAQHAADDPGGVPHYAPIEGGPPGHNLDDWLMPFGRRLREMVVDPAELGYGYAAPAKPLLKAALARSPFEAEGRASPFWAE